MPKAGTRVPLRSAKPDALFLRTNQVQDRYGLSKKWLARCRSEGVGGPPFYKVSGKLVLYKVEELEAWIAAAAKRHEAPVETEGEILRFVGREDA